MSDQIRILCVDDELSILKSIKRLFMDSEFEVFTATSGDEGLVKLSEHYPIQVVMSDYRMPGMNGVEFLHEVCRSWPETVRVVLSGYADTASIVSAINEGEIYKFIPKPWNDDELKFAIKNAAERYTLHKKNVELTEQLQDMNEELQAVNENLEKLVQKRTQDLEFQNQALIKSQNILDALPTAVIGLDQEGMVVLYNKLGAALFSLAMLGRDRAALFPPEINTFINSVIQEGFMVGNISFSGRIMKVKGRAMKEEDGQEGIVLVFDEL